MTDPHRKLPRDGACLRPRAFWRLVGRLEHETLEFKRSAGHLRDAIPAMAMSEGGAIVLGVSDERELVGRPVRVRAHRDGMSRAAATGRDGAAARDGPTRAATGRARAATR